MMPGSSEDAGILRGAWREGAIGAAPAPLRSRRSGRRGGGGRRRGGGVVCGHGDAIWACGCGIHASGRWSASKSCFLRLLVVRLGGASGGVRSAAFLCRRVGLALYPRSGDE